MVSNIESVYEELYNLHMNIFDHKKIVNPLTKSKYIIKENVHTEEREKALELIYRYIPLLLKKGVKI